VGPVAEKIDAVLFDLKHVDLERTGRVLAQDYAGALDNLIALSRRAHDLSVRVTLVPGFNDGEADLRAIAHWLRTVVQAPRVRLQAFHRMAAAKAEQTGRPYLFAEVRSLPADRLAEKLRPFQQEGIEVELV
jgi:pyruvate formate lyase activating enzyme